MREAQCATGWGEAPKATLRMNTSPHPAANEIRGDPPPPGEGEEKSHSTRSSASISMKRRSSRSRIALMR
jgi:hypothetical protein